MSYENSPTFQEGSAGLCHFCGNYGKVGGGLKFLIKNGKSMKLRGELGCEIPSMVGARIFSGTTRYTFLIKSLNFVWIACV